ncbi:MAG TPA: RHS repeat-associated core domain-containing protein [Anaerolineae bacterium]|nr:RHS repeat-associated core domain-containing protein [Anaerolineae bacterium]
MQTYTYAPFGELLSAQGTRASTLQYTGEQTDLDTGLVYLRARWYDSATERFTTRDPFPGFAGCL